jgi:tetratricopeptide (TPR) repeat protein
MYKKTTAILSLRILPFLFAFFLIACGGKEKPILEKEAREFAKKLEQSIEKKDGQFMDDAVDRDEIIKRAGLKSSSSAREFGAGIRKAANMGTKIVEALKEEGSYELVKVYEKESKQHMIFRLYSDGSINYHDMELKRKKGDIKIADIFVYTSGENLSTTIKGIYDQFEGIIDKSNKTDAWISSLPDIRKKINAGEYQKAYDLFMKIPEEGRKSKAFRIVKVEICTGLDDEKHQQAIDELLAAFPNEANMQLILMDAFFMRKEYDKVMGAINAVDKMINKDPFLDYYRYLCYNVMENPVKAKEHLLLVTANYPAFADAQLELAATYLEENNSDSARIVVKNFRQRKSFPQTRMDELLDAYPDFTME